MQIAETKAFRSAHPELMFVKADKGNTTVVIPRIVYDQKMNEQLSDPDTYKVVRYDMVSTLQDDVSSLTAGWVAKNRITKETRVSISKRDCAPPRAYGLPKIHKEGVPLRIIVSFINSPTYHLARLLNNWISPNITPPLSRVKDSFCLVERVKNLVL